MFCAPDARAFKGLRSTVAVEHSCRFCCFVWLGPANGGCRRGLRAVSYEKSEPLYEALMGGSSAIYDFDAA